MRKISFLFLLLHFSLFAAIRMENAEQIRSSLRLDQYPHHVTLENLKIAVIDNGFSGFENDGKYLPTSTTLVTKYEADFIRRHNLGDPEYHLEMAQTEHGRIMAQTVWGVTGSNERGPKFFLLNANGITNFRRAVRYAIETKVDLILYAQNRECCGNFDGRGFLNDIVNEATSAGILWINAAGNYGGKVYNGQFTENKELRLKSHLDENPAQVILTWNSSGTTETSGTDKDLDLFLYDENNQEVAKSELKQVLQKPELAEGETFLPRERIKFTFSKNRSGNYKVVVKSKSNNFGIEDRIRVVVIPDKAPTQSGEQGKMVEAVELLDATPGAEIMVPADNASVITVGDLETYTAKGPTADGRSKPEILLESSATSFSDGQSSQGTSNAAAIFTGVAAVLKSYRTNLTRSTLLSFPKKQVSIPRPAPLSEFAALHREILRFVDGLAEESPVLVGRYGDGRYALGMAKSPDEFLGQFCGLNSSNPTEFYLLYNAQTQRVQCFTRSKQPGTNGREASYPWELSRGASRQDYVEIRQVRTQGGANPNALSQGIWMTPLPEEIFSR